MKKRDYPEDKIFRFFVRAYLKVIFLKEEEGIKEAEKISRSECLEFIVQNVKKRMGGKKINDKSTIERHILEKDYKQKTIETIELFCSEEVNLKISISHRTIYVGDYEIDDSRKIDNPGLKDFLEEYDMLVRHKSLSKDIYDNIIERVKSKEKKSMSIKKLGLDNLIGLEDARKIEHDTPNVTTYVITRDLGWAAYYVDKIAMNTKKGSIYKYLITASSDICQINKDDILDFFEKASCRSSIEVLDLTKNLKSKSDNDQVISGKIVLEEFNISFPNPNDIVIYENINLGELDTKYDGFTTQVGKVFCLGVQGMASYKNNGATHRKSEMSGYAVLLEPELTKTYLRWMTEFFKRFKN